MITKYLSKFNNTMVHGLAYLAIEITLIFLAFLAGVIVAIGVATREQVILFSIFLLIILFLSKKSDVICYIAIMLMFIPLSLGTVFKIKIVSLAEPLILVLFIFIVKDVFVARKSSSTFSIIENPFLLPIILYSAVLIFNFLRYPLPASSIIDAGSEIGGIRFYYEKFMVFMLSFSISFLVEKDFSFSGKLLKIMLWMCIIVNVIGFLLLIFPNISDVTLSLIESNIFSDTAMLTGSWTKGFDPFTNVPRVGAFWGTALGILILVSGSVLFKKDTVKILLLILLVIGIIISATRSFFFGVLIAMTVWAFITNRKKTIIVFILISAVFFVLTNFGLFSKQFGRLFYFPTDLERMTTSRYGLFVIYWESFLGNPLLGVGVGGHWIPGFLETSLDKFMMENLRFGGHGFFLGTLYTQGIVGVIPIILLFVRCWITSFKIYRNTTNRFFKSICVLVLMFIPYSIIALIVGGSETYNQLFILVGILSGINIVYNKKING